MHLPAIIQDLAIILIVAGAMTLIFRAIRQPVVLGYIVAGFLVGPHFTWLPNIIDNDSVKVWAEIGVIFLLFALGLEFSFKKLARVGAPASITAGVEVAGMVVVGYLLGQAFGWNNFDSLFLGGILAISSTTIIIRAFEELDMKTRGFVRLVFGVLIVEDLFAILLMVLLTTVAVSQKFSGVEMGVAFFKLVFFLTLWFVLGIFLIPSFLNRVKKYLTSETLLVVSLGLCFLMVVLATKVDFSPALGAFIMGSILAETMEGERIEHLIHPIKDLFGAIFFVSVGMLIDPQVLVQYAVPIIAITFVTLFGKLMTTVTGSLLAGQSLRHSVQSGMSLAQIGEFSFIIAGLGLSLKVTSDFLYPIAISVSAITTFTTPYLIRSSDPLVDFLEKKLPPKWIQFLEKFRTASASVSHTSHWRTIMKTTGLQMVANSVVVIAVFLTASEFIKPSLINTGWNTDVTNGFLLLVAFIFSAPFLWAIAGKNPKGSEAFLNERQVVAPLFAFGLLRSAFAVVLTATLASRLVPPGSVIIGVCVLVIAIVYLLPKHFARVYGRFERRFVSNLNEKEKSDQKGELSPLAPWDSHLAKLSVTSDSPLIGKSFSELMLREKYGVTIALIERGHKKIPTPNRDAVLFPGDVLQVIGTDDQIHKFRQDCAPTLTEDEKISDANYILQSIFVKPEAPYANKSIRESGIREQFHGLVVGIEKREKRTLNPDSSILIEPGDTLWLVGDQMRLQGLN